MEGGTQCCAICKGEMKNNADDPTEFLPCTHAFHCYCIGEMALNNQDGVLKCPLCRTEISPEVSQQLKLNFAKVEEFREKPVEDQQMPAQAVGASENDEREHDDNVVMHRVDQSPMAAAKRKAPPMMWLSGHNHSSAIAHIGTSDDLLGQAIVSFIGNPR